MKVRVETTCFLCVLLVACIGCSKKTPDSASVDDLRNTTPDHPLMDIHKAIELGNVEQAWANIYHKTFDINLGRDPVPLGEALYHESRARERKGVPVSEAHNKIAMLLIEAGADVNRECFGNRYPLEFAVRTENFPMFRFLLEHGADPNIGYNPGWTLIEHLADVVAIEYLEVLIKHGADVNYKHPLLRICSARTDHYWQLRATSSQIESVREDEVPQLVWKGAKMLLDAGADVNKVKRHYGNTEAPLFAAVERQDAKLVKLLLDYGASTDIQRQVRDSSIRGEKIPETPLSLARKKNDAELIRLLGG